MGIIKTIHVSCALLSISGFFLRGLLMINESYLLQARITRIAPHIIDTALLISAIVLAAQWGWTALQQPWLIAKIIALLAYIGLGLIALREGRAMVVRIGAWLGAMAVFAYIVSVALTKNPYIL